MYPTKNYIFEINTNLVKYFSRAVNISSHKKEQLIAGSQPIIKPLSEPTAHCSLQTDVPFRGQSPLWAMLEIAGRLTYNIQQPKCGFFNKDIVSYNFCHPVFICVLAFTKL